MSDYQRIKELEKELRSHPVGSSGYLVKKEELENLLLESDKEKYEKLLVCFGSVHLADTNALQRFPAPKENLFVAWGVSEMPWEKWMSEEDRPLMQVLNELYPYTADGVIRFVPRYKAEYDLRYRQLIVVTYITDGEKVVVLSTNINNRIAEKLTFIQGHVEFSPEIYFNTELEYLNLSVTREIEEELRLKDKESLVLDRLPRFVVNRKENFADLEHYGVVFEARVKNVDEFLSTVESGESDKHTVTSISIKEVESYKGQLDDWAFEILTKLNNPNRE